jgi:hypothetical protein
VTQDTFDYEFQKAVVTQLGGAEIQAVREAIAEARVKAEEAGKAAMKQETCATPCERFVYVDTTIDTIETGYTKPKRGGLKIHITGR